MNRRELLTSGMTFSMLAGAGRLFAGAATSPRFLLVFLRGGYDCANLLVPYTSSDYYRLRPHIAIPKPDGSPTGALALDGD